MKKVILTIAVLLTTVVAAQAQDSTEYVRNSDAVTQELKIGYFSYKNVLQSMPAYGQVVADLDNLRKQYANEMNAVQKEFNEKYEVFLTRQAGMAESIRKKHQADLQTLLERNEQFRKESERLLKQAEKDAMAPLHNKLKDAIDIVGNQDNYLIIVNTDSEACPFIAKKHAVDVTKDLLDWTK